MRCVQALLNQSLGDQLEVIVVDNHSCDDSIGVLRNRLGKEERVHIIETPRNLGYGQGNAYGAQFAHGPYLLIINPDTLLAPSGAEDLCRYLEQHSDVGIVAPKLEFDDGAVRSSFRTFPTLADVTIKRTPLRRLFPKNVDRYLRRGEVPSAPAPVDWVVGACLCIPKALFTELHGFDPQFFLFFEDTDLCRRCAALGKQVVYHPGITARDARQRLSGEGAWELLFTRAGRQHMRSAMLYFAKWGLR